MAETILIVDDEADSRELLEAILVAAGYRVEQADSGAAALAQATASPPDLLLLDLMLPGMNGFEVCQRLKHSSATGAVPIIVVTALGEVRDKEAALTSGADDFVTKPVQPDDLRTRVRAMLKVRRIRQELDRTLAYLHELEATRRAQRRATLVQLFAWAGPGATPSSSSMRVLLVDDEALSREFYGDLLAEHGFQVFAVSTGADGLELARKHPVGAVLLDIVMPGMSGLEVLDRLHKEYPDLPVLILTSHPTSQNAITALKLGAFDFIVKGLDPTLVVLAIHRVIRYHREALRRKEENEHLHARIAELESRPAAHHVPGFRATPPTGVAA